MDTTKSHGFFLVSFLVLMFLGDPTEACSCMQPSLRDACCKRDFVMRTQFKSVRLDPNSPPYMSMNMFTIRPIQIFKGPKALRNRRVLFSPKDDSTCGYLHRGRLRGEEYLISGSIFKNRLQITMCDFAKPWHEVNIRDKINLNSLAGRECSAIYLQG